MSKLSKQVKEVLSGDKPASELKAMWLQVRARASEVWLRLNEVSADGAARRTAVQAGDSELVKKLDDESRDLTVEHEILLDFERQLLRAFDTTLAAEFVANMPDTYAEIRECLELEQEALRALETTREATNQRLSAIQQGRLHLGRCAMTCGVREQPEQPAAADPSLFRQYLQVRGLQNPQNWGSEVHAVNRTADCLGIDPAHLHNMVRAA